MTTSWTLEGELGEAALSALLTDFYDRLFADIMIGFFFAPHDKQRLIEHQYDYVCAHVGQKTRAYTGRSMRKAHAHLPILVGHFDRRHQLLRDVLADHAVPTHVMEAWLELDASLRDFIVRTGDKERARRSSEPSAAAEES